MSSNHGTRGNGGSANGHFRDQDHGHADANRHVFANADHKAVMFETFKKYPAVGTNGGTAAGLVGSYDQVAERINAFHKLGIELFMLQFQPLEAELRRFATHVIPRVRRTAVPA